MSTIVLFSTFSHYSFFYNYINLLFRLEYILKKNKYEIRGVQKGGNGFLECMLCDFFFFITVSLYYEAYGN